MNLIERIDKLQRIVNENQSLMGYGTASEPRYSGEVHCLEHIKQTDKSGIIFDVGAHEGEWVLMMKMLYPEYEYHCFEPDPLAFALLEKNVREKFGENHNVKLNNFALTATSGNMTLYTHQKGAAQCSLIQLDLEHKGAEFNIEQTISGISINEYCAKNNISEILFLKMDIEGYEFELLSSAMIIVRKIKFIQFEYGSANIDARVFLKDFYKKFRGIYNFYRVHPDGLYPANDYRDEFECFNLANYFMEKYN